MFRNHIRNETLRLHNSYNQPECLDHGPSDLRCADQYSDHGRLSEGDTRESKLRSISNLSCARDFVDSANRFYFQP